MLLNVLYLIIEADSEVKSGASRGRRRSRRKKRENVGVEEEEVWEERRRRCVGSWYE